MKAAIATHTPGPWSVQGDRDSDTQELHIVQDAQMDAEIAVLYPMLGYAGADVANAKLIAAAPELLSALEDAFSDLNLYWRNDWTNRALANKIRAAIAKAKGEL